MNLKKNIDNSDSNNINNNNNSKNDKKISTVTQKKKELIFGLLHEIGCIHPMIFQNERIILFNNIKKTKKKELKKLQEQYLQILRQNFILIAMNLYDLEFENHVPYLSTNEEKRKTINHTEITTKHSVDKKKEAKKKSVSLIIQESTKYLYLQQIITKKCRNNYYGIISKNKEDIIALHQILKRYDTYFQYIRQTKLYDKTKQYDCCSYCLNMYRNLENEEENMKICSRCQQETYCSKKCQVLDWPFHKEHCQIHYDKLMKIINDYITNGKEKKAITCITTFFTDITRRNNYSIEIDGISFRSLYYYWFDRIIFKYIGFEKANQEEMKKRRILKIKNKK